MSAVAQTVQVNHSLMPQAPQPVLGEIMIARGDVGEADIAKALSFQSTYGGRIGAILVRIGAVSEDKVIAALASQLGLPVLLPEQLPQDPAEYAACIKSSGIAIDWWIDQSALVWTGSDGVVNCISRDPVSANLRETLGDAFADKSVRWWLIRNRDLDLMMDLVRRAMTTDGVDIDGDVALLRELAEQVTIETVDPLKPAVLRGGTKEFLYLLMPVRIT